MINVGDHRRQRSDHRHFTSSAEVNDLVTVLKYGALPLAIQEVSFSQISATLGLNFLQQSILAGAIGIALVFVFMLIHYRLPGVIACIALIFYAIVVVRDLPLHTGHPDARGGGGLCALGGYGGRRQHPDLRAHQGRAALRQDARVSAIEAGFNRAWNSIFDSNMSSIITATILFYFGSATIRGFALVLIIGVLLSMFTAVTLSRMMLRFVVRQSWARKASYFGVAEDEFVARGASAWAAAPGWGQCLT